MGRLLYDLAGADERLRFSPYCWRIKMALAHKRLAFETVPWRFTDRDAIAFSGQSKVPVFMDGEHTVTDSWAIATYLEDTYPDRPSLFGGPGGLAVTRFMNSWGDRIVMGGVAALIVADVVPNLAEQDRDYFMTSREKMFGKPLDEVIAGRDDGVKAFRATLDPMRAVLRHQPFMGGAQPLYADYIPFGVFQWARCVSPFELLAPDDPLWAWRERMLDQHDGLARKAITREAVATG